MKQGFENAIRESAPDHLLFTDVDITHAPDNLRRLVTRAERGNLMLGSLMAKLHCNSFAEKLLIPAFVYFFDMLFPFAWKNDPGRKTASAAGGCMLARRQAFMAAGNLDAISHEIIDDCALAGIMKRQGAIWLGLTERTESIRPYDGVGEIRHMIARSAYLQLGYSPLILLGTVLGMIAIYAAAPVFAVLGPAAVHVGGRFVWAAMALAFQPILRVYRLSPLWGLALPAIGAIYAGFTIDSALQFWRGRGGMWKGRAQATVLK